jgi:glutamate mutase epsilon subunit
MNEPVFKYRIDELLNKLTVKDYRKALLIVPQLLNISQKTFNNYRKIKLEDKQDIPHEKVVILEKLFVVSTGELQNFTFVVESIFDFDEKHDLEPLRVQR